MSEASSDGRKARAARLTAAAVVAAALAAGCGAPPTASAPPSASQARYENLSVDIEVSDEIFVLWRDTWRSEMRSSAQTDWGAPRLAGVMAAEILRDAGATVADPDDPGAVSVVIRQAPVDAFGRTYNPGRDFLLAGLVGLAAGAARRETDYQPRFALAIHDAGALGMIGPSRCSIALYGEIAGGAAGGTTALAVGQELIETPLEGGDWNALSDEEREIVRERCLSALRRGVAQILTRLDVVG